MVTHFGTALDYVFLLQLFQHTDVPLLFPLSEGPSAN